MTPTEILKKECEEITRKTGIYIPTYRMASILAKASKVFDTLVKNDVCTTYNECLIILRIVMKAIQEVTGEEET